MHAHLHDPLMEEISASCSPETLYNALTHCTRKMGFDHFALSYERRSACSQNLFLLHDYPDGWARIYTGFELAGADPVRRASDRSMTGFAWARLPSLVPLSQNDRKMLSIGEDNGIADGYTVPRHLPGDASGTCSFAMRPGRVIPQDMLHIAEIIGALALSVARQFSQAPSVTMKPVLSDRQRECVLWSARGKTAGETASILGVSEQTVVEHFKAARDRYDVHCRQALILCALFDGSIGFGDIFDRH